ncbi:phosphatase PAP2 family protein [Mesorhizobium yinganensis]|uniref:phosphatase PAP2 family protein n=1 Tax=Mesorhizobium yinganensis TaxID=3157707 RepID=UPI0032B7B2B2
MTDIAAVRHPDLATWRPTRHLPVLSGRTLAWIAIVTLATFSLFPALDIAASKLFFVERPCKQAQALLLVCGDFPARAHLAHLRQVLQALPFIAAISLGLCIAVKLMIGGRLESPLARKASTAVWTYAIGVGLVVNVVLKGYSGRPRPINTDLFGGDFPFVAAGEITSYCTANCSFVSGEMASATWLLCVVPLLPAAWRKTGFGLATGFAALTGVLRIAFGAHYLSDVLLAAIVTLAVHHLVTATAVKLHSGRPHLAADTLSTISGQTRRWLRQAKEWPRRKASWT